MESDWCFGIPIDHRLKRFLTKPHKNPLTKVGLHILTYRRYGRSLQESQARSPSLSEEEIKFGEWLARPSRRGGLVVALLQPAREQRYDRSAEQVKEDCATLYYLDDVLQVIASASLADTSCFDAFPFYLETSRKGIIIPRMREAYETFVEMVRQKKPDVILCAWQAPKMFGDVRYHSRGVGAVNETEIVVVDGHPIKLVNAFHPSYAINYHPNESCFRQLFLLEMAKAFAELDEKWVEEPWMQMLRAFCKRRASALAKENASLLPDRCERRFQEALTSIEKFIRNWCSNDPTYLGNDKKIYDAILEYQLQRHCCDALLIVSISKDRDLRPFPERKHLVSVVGKRCLRLLEHCVKVHPKRSRGKLGFVDIDDIAGMTFPKAAGTSQARWGILELFKNFLIELNCSFWPGGERRWNFHLAEIETAFENLTKGLEAKLAEMHENANVERHVSMEALVQEFEPLRLGN